MFFTVGKIASEVPNTKSLIYSGRRVVVPRQEVNFTAFEFRPSEWVCNIGMGVANARAVLEHDVLFWADGQDAAVRDSI